MCVNVQTGSHAPPNLFDSDVLICRHVAVWTGVAADVRRAIDIIKGIDMNKLIYVRSVAAFLNSITGCAAADRYGAGSGIMKDGMPASGKAGGMGKSMDHPKR